MLFACFARWLISALSLTSAAQQWKQVLTILNVHSETAQTAKVWKSEFKLDVPESGVFDHYDVGDAKW